MNEPAESPPTVRPDDKAGLPELPAWAEKLVRFLDDGIKLPGTKGIGADALIGLIFPGAGDVATGLGSLGLFLLAFRERVPPIILVRMMVNMAVDVIAGTVPIVGDFFDFLWRANRKNIELIRQYRDPQRKPGAADYLVVTLALGAALFSVALPFLLVLLLGTSLLGLVFGGEQ